MADSNPIKEEVLALLAEHNDFARGNIPFAKLIGVYKRYEDQEFILYPNKKKTTIYEEFSLLCKKGKLWMLSYVRLTRLDLDLLNLINVRIGPFYLSVAIAVLLCNHPRQVQKKLLERAKELSQGRQPWLRYYVEELGKLYEKGDYATVPPALVHYERPARPTATSWPAPASASSPQTSQTILSRNESAPKIDTFDKKTRDDELFLQILAKTPTIKTRAAEPPPKEQIPQWHGDRKLIQGKRYAGTDFTAQEPD